MVPSTAPEDIASYANRVANAWKIGRRDVGDGVCCWFVAKNDRRLRIEVAKTLEGAIPDLAAKRIIDGRSRRPCARATSRPASGRRDRIAGLIRGEALPPAAVQPGRAAAGTRSP